MKLRYAAVLGTLAGLAALVALPSIGQVGDIDPIPVADEVEEVLDGDVAAAATIPSRQNGTAGPNTGATHTGIGHWVNNGPYHEACMHEKYEVYGPKEFCTRMVIGGRKYHIQSYDPVKRRYRVKRLF